MMCLLGGAWLGLTWVAYPAWLGLRARGKPPVSGGPFRGRVAILVVARNEGPRIAERLRELRALDAPDGLEVVLVDDGSDDGTAAIARAAFDPPWPGLRIARQDPLGKATGLALAASLTTAELLVFADVRQRIDPHALAPLLEPFADPAIGVVSGVVEKPATTAAGLYWRYESLVRRLESRSGSTIGATGPWYAVRRELFVPPPRGLLLDDVWIPMQAVFAGARAVVAERAVVRDVEHPPATERHKKARTLTGNLQLLEAWPALLDPRQNPVWGRYLVHKVLRLGTPFALGALAAGSLGLALAPGPLQPLAAAVVAAEAALVALALAGNAPARSLIDAYLASLEAWWRFARRDFAWAGSSFARTSGSHHQ